MNDTSKQHGQPPKLGAALNPSQRQGAYRERMNKALGSASVTTGSVNKAATLLASVTYHSSSINAHSVHADTAQGLAAPLIAAVCARYEVQLTSQ
jgi:hypothetical protein